MQKPSSLRTREASKPQTCTFVTSEVTVVPASLCKEQHTSSYTCFCARAEMNPPQVFDLVWSAKHNARNVVPLQEKEPWLSFPITRLGPGRSCGRPDLWLEISTVHQRAQRKRQPWKGDVRHA